MRGLIILLASAGFLVPAYGAKRIMVSELEQTLAANRGLPDAEVSKQLSDLELTERLATAKFSRLEASLPGEKSRQALMVLADMSAFLAEPAADIPEHPAPDLATQRKILALTVNYAKQSVQQLPNFFATRVTRSFEDRLAVQPSSVGAAEVNQSLAYLPMHLVGDTSVPVSFRDGHEVLEKANLDPRVRNLETAGVFGPIVGTVLVDAARSKLAWSHWEQGSAGLQAVFSYEVRKEKSHYTITYDTAPTNNPCVTAAQPFSTVVAYHGEMAIDPASGTIIRLMLQADLKPDEFAPAKSGIVVEYGQVSIGGEPYFLPVRSVTFSLGHSLHTVGGWGHGQGCPTLSVTPGLQTSLNDVVFENYHVFRSDATVLTDSEAAKLERQPLPAPDGSQKTGEANPLCRNRGNVASANQFRTFVFRQCRCELVESSLARNPVLTARPHPALPTPQHHLSPQAPPTFRSSAPPPARFSSM